MNRFSVAQVNEYMPLNMQHSFLPAVPVKLGNPVLSLSQSCEMQAILPTASICLHPMYVKECPGIPVPNHCLAPAKSDVLEASLVRISVLHSLQYDMQ